MHITLRQLEVFAEVHKSGSTTQASQMLALSQSAVSAALTDLEGQLGVQLFDRVGKRLVVNEHGRLLYPRALALLERALEIEQLFRGDNGAIRVYASSTIGNYIMPEIIARYRHDFPDLPVELSVGNSLDVINAVADLRVDFGLIEGPCHAADIIAEPWLEDELVVFAAPNSPLLAGEVTLQQLAEAPFAGGFSAMIGVAMIVGFSFQGTELIGIAAGESENPEKNIPRAVRQVFWRILLFYVFAILIISLIIPYTDPSLLRNDVKDISVSPFTLVFQHAGLLSAAAIMNAVILTAVLSAGNSGMYASTRMLYTLACDGKAPRIFSKLSRGGVPRNALYATTVIAALCFLTSMFGNQTVYLWLLNTSGMTGFIAWLGIAISHYRFRRGYVLQGNDINNLPYRSGFFPLGPIFAFVLCLIITLGQNYEAFLKDTIDWGGVAATYIGIPLFLVIWFGYKLAKGTRFVRYSEMTFPDRFKR